ncbi:hypothetical protein ACFSTD_13160 [Novosphingobium colocasiae]
MNAGELGRFLFDQPLLALTIGAILLAVMGLRIDSAAPRLGGIVRGTGYIGMVAALLLTVAGLAGHNRRSEAALWLDSAKPAGGSRGTAPSSPCGWTATSGSWRRSTANRSIS